MRGRMWTSFPEPPRLPYARPWDQARRLSYLQSVMWQNYSSSEQKCPKWPEMRRIKLLVCASPLCVHRMEKGRTEPTSSGLFVHSKGFPFLSTISQFCFGGSK